MFSLLPDTKQSEKAVDTTKDDEIEDFIPKYKPTEKLKEKQKVKISIPSLSEFDPVDDDEPKAKKAKPSAKGSGLIGILPPVQGAPLTTKSFVPKVVTDKKPIKQNTQLVPNVIRQKAAAKKAQILKKLISKGNSSDAESDDDFEMPETFDDEMWEKVCGRPKQKKTVQPEEPAVVEETINIAPEPEKPYDGLDNEAFKELVGKSKRPIGNIKLIDVNEEEIVPERDIWMAKSLTDPELAPKEEVENPVDPTRRKRHHITYLAQQAKANEQDLKNQWASSKNNRMATRAKYGF